VGFKFGLGLALLQAARGGPLSLGDGPEERGWPVGKVAGRGFAHPPWQCWALLAQAWKLGPFLAYVRWSGVRILGPGDAGPTKDTVHSSTEYSLHSLPGILQDNYCIQLGPLPTRSTDMNRGTAAKAQGGLLYACKVLVAGSTTETILSIGLLGPPSCGILCTVQSVVLYSVCTIVRRTTVLSHLRHAPDIFRLFGRHRPCWAMDARFRSTDSLLFSMTFKVRPIPVRRRRQLIEETPNILPPLPDWPAGRVSACHIWSCRWREAVTGPQSAGVCCRRIQQLAVTARSDSIDKTSLGPLDICSLCNW
jgi:hypothetical protein